jgi:hypothetical protein
MIKQNIQTKKKILSHKNNSTQKSFNKTGKDCVYTKDDFNSNDGMLTTVWGPSMWHFLHTMSFNYPVEPTSIQKKKYMQFVFNLKYILPCGKCRKNFTCNLSKNPLTMSDMKNRETFSKFIYNLHEVVNKMLGKKSNLSYDDVKERYEHFRARCATPYSELEKSLGKVKNEVGCIEPLYGEKSKCILKVIPQYEKCDTFQIDDKCIKKKIPFNYKKE